MGLLGLIREAATRMYPPTIDKDGKITDADDRAGDAINKVVTSISVEVHRGRAGMLLKMYRTAVFTSRNVGAIGADGSTVTGPEPIHQRALKGAMRPGATVHKPRNPKPAGKGGRPAKKWDGRKRGHRCATIPRDLSGDVIAGAQPGSEKEPTSPGRDPLVARLFPSTPTGHTLSPPSPSHDQQGEPVELPGRGALPSPPPAPGAGEPAPTSTPNSAGRRAGASPSPPAARSPQPPLPVDPTPPPPVPLTATAPPLPPGTAPSTLEAEPIDPQGHTPAPPSSPPHSRGLRGIGAKMGAWLSAVLSPRREGATSSRRSPRLHEILGVAPPLPVEPPPPPPLPLTASAPPLPPGSGPKEDGNRPVGTPDLEGHTSAPVSTPQRGDTTADATRGAQLPTPAGSPASTQPLMTLPRQWPVRMALRPTTRSMTRTRSG